MSSVQNAYGKISRIPCFPANWSRAGRGFVGCSGRLIGRLQDASYRVRPAAKQLRPTSLICEVPLGSRRREHPLTALEELAGVRPKRRRSGDVSPRARFGGALVRAPETGATRQSPGLRSQPPSEKPELRARSRAIAWAPPTHRPHLLPQVAATVRPSRIGCSLAATLNPSDNPRPSISIVTVRSRDGVAGRGRHVQPQRLAKA